MKSPLVLCVVPLVFASASLRAQPASEATGAYRPPVMRFDDKGIPLIEAVRLTLANDPNIKLRTTDLELQTGVAQQATGQFDWTLHGTAKFQHQQQELRDSQKRDLQKQRDDLDRAIPIVTAKRDAYGQALNNLNNPVLNSNPGSVDLSGGISDTDVKNEMDLLKAQLILIQDLINKTADGKLRQDFSDLRTQAIERSVSRFQSLYDAVKTQPEELRQLRADLGDTPQEQWSNTGSLSVELDKQFRSGITIKPYTSLDYSAANYVGKSSWDPAKGGLGVKDAYNTKVGFDVILPLGRGRGRDDVAATETAALVQAEARKLLIVHQETDSVLQTMLAYWDLRAAMDQQEVLERSVKLEGELLNLTRQLIKAQDVARAEETRVLAAYANSQAGLEAGLRRVSDARVNLARLMGVAIDDARLAPLAAEPLPQPPAGLSGTGLTQLAGAAANRRFDYRAANKAQDAGLILTKGAKLETRRVFNLTVGGWGTSVSEDKPKLGSWAFRSGHATLDFEVPFGNDTQQGLFLQQQASLHQATISATDLARTISLNVFQAGEALRLAVDKIKSADEAVRYYDKTIDDERAKLRSGDSTLIDTILTEQQTTAARMARITALQEYAGLLARLRFESGLLVEEARGGGNVITNDIMTVPAALVGPAPQK
jgi:outer membrane protein TolC